MKSLKERKISLQYAMIYIFLLIIIVYHFISPSNLNAQGYRVTSTFYGRFNNMPSLFVNNKGDILAGNYYYDQSKSEWTKTLNGSCPSTFFYTNDKKNLFAYSDTALYRSSDDGRSWTDVLFNHTSINRIEDYAVNPINKEIYLSLQGKIYKSNDLGNNWEILDQLPTTDSMAAMYSFYWLEFDSKVKLFAVPSYSYIKIKLSNFLTSTDGGKSWENYPVHLYKDTLAQTGVSQFEIINDSLQIINTSWELSLSHNYFKSTDTIIKKRYLYELANFTYYDPITKKMFADHAGNNFTRIIYKSTDNGHTFDSVYTISNVEHDNMPFVVDKSGNIFVSSYNIFKIDSSFYKQELIGDFWENSKILSIDTTVNGYLVFGTDKSQIIEGLDSNYLNQKVHYIDTNQQTKVNSIFRGTNNNWLIICDSNTIFNTTDKFDKFVKSMKGLENSKIYKLISNNDRLYISTSDGIYYSDDTAQSWIQILPAIDSCQITDYLIDNTGVLYAGTDSRGIFTSSLSNPAWKRLSNGLGSMSITQIVKNSKNEVFTTVVGYGVYKFDKSTNAWVEKNSEIKKYIPLNINKIYIDNFDNIEIFLSNGYFYYSTNNAESWANVRKLYNQYDFDTPIEFIQIDSCHYFYSMYNGNFTKFWIDSSYIAGSYWFDSINVKKNLIFIDQKSNGDLAGFKNIIYHKNQNQFSTFGPDGFNIRTWDLKTGDIIKTSQVKDANFIVYIDDSLVYWFGYDNKYLSTDFYLKGYNYRECSYIQDSKLNGFQNDSFSAFFDGIYDYVRSIIMIKKGKAGSSGPKIFVTIGFDQFSSNFQKRINLGNRYTYALYQDEPASDFDYLYSQKNAEYLFKSGNTFNKYDTNGNIIQYFDKPDSSTKNIRTAVLSNDNNCIAGFVMADYKSNYDSVMVVWNYQTGSVMHITIVHLILDDYNFKDRLYLMKFTPDDKYLVIANPSGWSPDTRIFFVDVQTGTVVKTILLPDFAITSFTFTEGYQIVAGCSDGYLRLVDLDMLLGVPEDNPTGLLNSGLELSISPNPAGESALLGISSKGASSCSIAVYDLFGREVYKIDNSSLNDGITYINLNLSGLEKGCYFVKAAGASGIGTLTFIKN